MSELPGKSEKPDEAGTRPAEEESDPVLVTAGSYLDALEAHLARSKLEREGIRAYLADENIVNLDWFYTQAVGGVKVQVEAHDVARAREVLRAKPEETGAPRAIEGYTCPACGSEDVRLNLFGLRLSFFFLWLCALPLPFRPLRCGACRHAWKPRRRGRAPTA